MDCLMITYLYITSCCITGIPATSSGKRRENFVAVVGFPIRSVISYNIDIKERARKEFVETFIYIVNDGVSRAHVNGKATSTGKISKGTSF